MKTKTVWMVMALALAGGIGFVVLRQRASPAVPVGQPVPAVAVATEGRQMFEVFVKEGYRPKDIIAKAGVPMLLKMKTLNTFDCSSAFSIPKLGVRTRLQPTGETIIEIPAQKAGDSLYGVCGMGMYSLVIKFI